MIVPSLPKTSSPLVFGRQKPSERIVHTTLASIPHTLSPLHASTQVTDPNKSKELAARKTSSRAKSQAVKLAKTIIEQADSEVMEVDVGEPFQPLDLPEHLKDHSYSLYNPVEGEKLVKPRTGSFKMSTNIPPARVSYAPQVSVYARMWLFE